MKVAVNALPAYPGAAGIGRYAANVAHSLIRYGEGTETVILTHQGSEFAGMTLPGRVRTALCRPTGPLWEQLQLPGILQEYGADLYHSPLFTVPIARACKQLATIHDVIPEKMPECVPSDFLALYRSYFRPCLRAVDAVLTVSDYSRRDIGQLEGLDGKSVHVAYQALSEQFTAERARADEERVRRKLGTSYRHFLYIGSIEPRKNVIPLVEAFHLLQEQAKDVHLVLGGRRLFADYDPMARASELGMDAKVHYLGYVDDEDLPGLYAGAELLAYPSSYEGFGLPVAEALACGCPVVTAPNTSLPEAGGEAAVYADPRDQHALAEAMLMLLEDRAQRERRIALGLRHAAQFTRERFAQQLLEVYRRVLEGGEA
jgi:glycosyltransferase involved in cell wall biosynthesis